MVRFLGFVCESPARAADQAREVLCTKPDPTPNNIARATLRPHGLEESDA
ncbi:hypothetical protein [Streptomyces sp. bgisy159]